MAGVDVIGGYDVLLRLAVAAALGALIGLERELHEREAGIRTHMLVSLGSCLFTLVGAYGFSDVLSHGARADPTRIAAQVVTGIGFLGAGVILRQGLSVRGLTTAGSLWISSAIGLACGAASYWAAVVATALTLFALWPLRIVSRNLINRGGGTGRIVVELREGQSVVPLLEELGDVSGLEVADERGRRVVLVELAAGGERELIARLADLPYVLAVRSG